MSAGILAPCAFLAATARRYCRGHDAMTSPTLPRSLAAAGASASLSVELPSLPVQAAEEEDELELELETELEALLWAAIKRRG